MADLQTGFNDLAAAVNALVAEDASVVSAINALKAQVAAGSPVTGDQLEALAAQVTGVVHDMATAVAPPADAPAPAPPADDPPSA